MAEEKSYYSKAEPEEFCALVDRKLTQARKDLSKHKEGLRVVPLTESSYLGKISTLFAKSSI